MGFGNKLRSSGGSVRIPNLFEWVVVDVLKTSLSSWGPVHFASLPPYRIAHPNLDTFWLDTPNGAIVRVLPVSVLFILNVKKRVLVATNDSDNVAPDHRTLLDVFATRPNRNP